MVVRESSASVETQVQLPAIRCWAWSIRPLLIWIRILGVEQADISTLPSKNYRWLTFAYRSFCFLAQGACLVDLFCSLNAIRTRASLESVEGLMLFSTETGTWNWIIDFTNYGVHSIGTHIILLTAMRWVDLLESFNRMKVIFAANNYIQTRRVSSFGVVYIITMMFGILTLTIVHHLNVGTSGRRLFITFISTLSSVYPLTALVLFAIHCFGSSLAFELIQAEIVQNEIPLLNSRHEDVRLFVSAVTQKYFVACDTVNNINYSFGWILLLSTASFFVSIINSSFYLFGMELAITTLELCFFTYTAVHLALMCSMADRVSNKAEDVIRQLLNFKCAAQPLADNKIEMEFLVTQMAQAIPQISAHGYFNISKKLLPQVAGASLTYFFILCEFKASERRPLNLC